MRKQAWLAMALFVILAVTTALMLGGCGQDAPELTSITPSSGTPGSRVTGQAIHELRCPGIDPGHHVLVQGKTSQSAATGKYAALSFRPGNPL